MAEADIKINALGHFKGGTDRNALLFVFILLTGITVGGTSDAERQNSCQKFTADTEIQNLIASGRRGAEPCPCIEQKIILDNTFAKIENCYRQWFFRKGAKQRCCYSETGNLILEGPGAGYLLLEGKEETIERGHEDCCGKGSLVRKRSCQSFYELNPPDNCSAYVPPSKVTSSGDPVIETIDGNSYDFNGHGEYVFLTDSINFEIQARTDYVVKGNKDSTMFTAFALSHKKSGEQIELHYDRDANDIRFYRNGTYNEICNASTSKGKGRPYPCEMPTRYSCSVLAGGGQIIVSNCGFSDYAKQLTFKTDNLMSIEIEASTKDFNPENATGLAGHQVNGSYIMRNMSREDVNSSAYMLFQFAESWSLQNETESHFRYNQTGGSFKLYNQNHTRPEFLEDFVGNLTALFKNFPKENITRFNKTCRNSWNNEPNDQCLLTIARTGNFSLGVKVMTEANSAHHDWEILHNERPKFIDGMPNNITVVYKNDSSITIKLKDYVTGESKEKLIYDVETDLPANEYTLKDGVFIWNVSSGLRYLDTGFTFQVYDHFNASAVHVVTIYYCGCEEPSECDFSIPNTNSSESIQKALCKCPEHYSGLYCEHFSDPCESHTVTCYEAACNAATPNTHSSWPCLPCPKGRRETYVFNKQECDDIDECNDDYKGEDKCQQNCTNTNGSFTCYCMSGYTLNADGHSCDDVDECLDPNRCPDKMTEMCLNKKGSFECACAPGYSRDRIDGPCKKSADPSFPGLISFTILENEKDLKETNETINTVKYKDDLKKTLEEAFQGTLTGFQSVEVIRIMLILSANNRRKRDDSKSIELRAEYIVHIRKNDTKGNHEAQTRALQDAFTSYIQINNNSTLEIGNLNVQAGADLSIYDDDIHGLCSIQNRTDCEDKSTHCNNTFGGFDCVCKPGYKPFLRYKKACQDVDECAIMSTNEKQERCVHGTCLNTVGAWNCTCPSNKQWQYVGNETYSAFRCQGNYSYVGEASIQLTGNYTEIEVAITKAIWSFFQQSSIESDMYGVPFKRLLVDVNVVQLINESADSVNVTFILQMGEVVDRNIIANVLKELVDERDNLPTTNNLNATLISCKLFNDSDNKLCIFSNGGGCDKDTTNCKQYNGSTHCQCKQGFHKLQPADKFCEDDNECTSFARNNTTDERCVHGSCVNTAGSWNCSCPAGRTSQRLGNETYEVYRCQGDFQYIGQVEFLWLPSSVLKKTVNDFLDEKISSLFSNQRYVNESFLHGNPPMHDIFLRVEILNTTIQKNNGYASVSVVYILHIGESVLPGWIQEFQQNVFNESAKTDSGGGVNVQFLKSSIYNESGYNLCNIQNRTNCDLSSTNCSVHNGSYSCPCKSGYHTRLDGHHCKDRDECTDKSVICELGNCTNTVGSWECVCDKWSQFRRNNDTYGVCEDIDECDYNSTYICKFGKCHDKRRGWNCSCDNGYYPQEIVPDKIYTCIDIDECITGTNRICSNGGTCSNIPGNWTCECPAGFEVHYINESYIDCKDVDECSNRSMSFCSNGGTCVNYPGSWSCNCSAGFEQQRKTESFIECKDINECSNATCSNGGTCVNVPGKWKCECPNGFEVGSKNASFIECKDKNECQDKSVTCELGNCSNTVGSWECVCDKWSMYRRVNNSYGVCEDIDECNEKLVSCDGGSCKNIIGGWYCECPAGFTNATTTGDGRHLNCTDIDECKTANISCLEASGCVNAIGSWKCVCSEGLKETVVNKTSKLCAGDYQYVASVSFTLTGEVTDVGELQKAIKQKIVNMYMSTFNNDTSIWIEILKFNGLPGSSRKRRSVPRLPLPTRHNITADYIVHTMEQKTPEQLTNVEKVYRDKNCNSRTKVCEDHIDGFLVELSSVHTKNESAICETSKNMCDKLTSTCSSKNGLLKCNCNKGYTKPPGDEDTLLCIDINECKNTNQACANGTVCKNREGSWDCSCQERMKAVETTPGKKECLDPCSRSKCYIASTCKHFDNEDGYICGCQNGRKGKYCTEIDHDFKDSKQQTILIAVGSSLGGLVLILAAVILAVCRWRAGKIKEAERISMKNLDRNGFKSFDDSFLTNQYMRDRDDGGGSFYSYRLSNTSLPHEQQNGGIRNGNLPESMYSRPHKLPRPNFHGSMPNLANGDAHFSRSDNRRYSVEEPKRFTNYNQGMESNYDTDWRARRNNFTGRRSPSPDYGRRRSPEPDYHRMENPNRSNDSGVGNGYSSGSNEYRRPDKRGEYYYGNRRSTQF